MSSTGCGGLLRFASFCFFRKKKQKKKNMPCLSRRKGIRGLAQKKKILPAANTGAVSCAGLSGGVEIFFAHQQVMGSERISFRRSFAYFFVFVPMPSPTRGRMWSGAEHAPRTPFPPSTTPPARDLLLKKCSAAVFSKAIHGHAPPLQHRRCARSGASGHREQPSANPYRPLRRRYPIEEDFRGGDAPEIFRREGYATAHAAVPKNRTVINQLEHLSLPLRKRGAI